jgi:hypothetical protein
MKKKIAAKLSKLIQTMGIITRTLKPPQFQKHARLKHVTLWQCMFYCTGAKRGNLENRLTRAEVTFVSRTAKYIQQDYKTDKGFYQNLKLSQL